MKFAAVLFLLQVSSTLLAQDDSIPIIQAPTRTAIGKAAGEKVSARFSREGGRLHSQDGRLELVIPEGALGSRTTISIQPVENTLNPGGPPTYALLPSGVNFARPLQLIFHYTRRESPWITPQLRGIAWQDETGQWYRLENTVLDSAAMTISGLITHFSHWSYFDAFTLTPSRATVKVGKRLPMQIICTGVPTPGGGTVLTGESLPTHLSLGTYVDGVRGGSAATGTVTGVSGNALQFTAPGSVPDRNPVAVSVEAHANFTLNGTRFTRLKLVSYVTIVDHSFLITVSGHNTQNTLGCVITALDTSTCVLQLNGSRSRVQDLQNMNYRLDVKSCPCNLREVNPGGNIGPVNIAGAARIDVQPANPPQKPFATVTIYFIRNFGMISGMSIDPCGGQPGLTVPGMPILAVPLVLQFEAKPEEQVLKQGGDERNGFEVRVSPLEGDE